MTALDPDVRPTRLPLETAPVPLPAPREPAVLGTDVVALMAGFALVVAGMWARHGGLGGLTAGWHPMWASLAQLTGLAASAVGLVGLVLVARPRSIERRLGLDRMFVWHRVLGETMAVLVGAHVFVGVAEWAATERVTAALTDLTGREPYMALATIGAALIGLVTITSLRSLRRRLSYETWYFVHLLAYVGFAVSLPHEIVLGNDLADDRLARILWVCVHIAVAVWIVDGRWGPAVRAFARPLRVRAVRALNDDTVEITLAGSSLRSRRADAGQFVMLRALSPRLWWQAHPFSLSAAPDSSGLCVTVKRRGDASNAIVALPVGTRVAVEGPYGACTPSVIGAEPVLFVVGGVGVAPARALLQRLPASCRPIVLFRAHAAKDLVHIDDLRQLCHERGGSIHTLVGPTARLATSDPFSASALAAVVPDVAERVAVLCGPERLLAAARSGLRAVGVPDDRIHYERVWW